MPESPEQSSSKEKYEKLFVYAFFRADGENGVHEDLCTDVTVDEAIKHAKELWTDADEYRVSDTQLGDPYAYLFSEEKLETIKQRLALPEEAPLKEELEETLERLDDCAADPPASAPCRR